MVLLCREWGTTLVATSPQPQFSPLGHGQHSLETQVSEQFEDAVLLRPVEDHRVAQLDPREVL